MPTDNPKISGYVPQAVYDRFKEFQKEQNLSMSQVVTIILTEYFGLNQIIERTTEGTTIGGVTYNWVKSLEDRIINLEKEVEQSNSTSELPREESIKQVESQPNIEIIKNNNLEEINSKQENAEDEFIKTYELSAKMKAQTDGEEIWTPANLAKRLQVAASTISRNKGKKDFTEWTREKDPEKIGWIILESGQCKPEKPTSSDQGIKEQIESVVQEKAIPVKGRSTEEIKSSQLNLLGEPPNKIKLVTGVLLAKRLGVHKDTCPHYKKRLSSEEFYEWSKQKDFDGIGWIPNPNGAGYILGEELNSELLSKLQKWIEKNS